MEILFDPMMLLLATAKDVLPVLGLLVLFQTLVLKRPIPRPGKIIFGFQLAEPWRFSWLRVPRTVVR
jgi:hypothetical protein